MYKVTECYDFIKEMFFPTQPKWEKLTFTKQAWMKLNCYINLIGEFEITGFGRVVGNEIVDVKILEQTVKSTTVDCNLDAMQKFLMSIPKEETGQWILDWHSHVNMGVFASGTDSANYIEQYKARCNNQYPLIIVNKRQECYAKCYISTAKQTELKIEVKQEEVTEEQLRDIYETCKKDIEELCSKHEYKTTTKEDTRQTSFFPYSQYYTTSSDDDLDSDDYNSRWSNWSNYNNKIDLSKYKKKGIASLQKENVKNSCEQQENNSLRDEVCMSCYTALADTEELERGICDDCWEMMTPSDRASWILNLK